MSRRLTRPEQETVIRWNAADPMAEVWTCQPKILRKLKRLGYAPVREQGPGAWFELPKDRITLRRPGRWRACPRPPGKTAFFQPKSPPKGQELHAKSRPHTTSAGKGGALADKPAESREAKVGRGAEDA